MSLLTRKPPVSSYAMFGAQAKSAARQAVPAAINATTTAAQQAAPIARQAMPLARNAGASVKQGADDAVAWATPYADAARAWAAPILEHSAQAISENIAPMISDALITAAHKIDTKPPKNRRRFGKSSLLAASMLLIAAGAAAVVTMRNRGIDDLGYTATDYSAGKAESVHIIGEDTGEKDQLDPDANGHPQTG